MDDGDAQYRPIERLGAMVEPVPNTGRRFAELRTSGLLWLINRVVFHPRGFALGIEFNEAGEAIGWQLFGEGREPYSFGSDFDENALFDAAERTLLELDPRRGTPRSEPS